ncbi:Epiglycanin [Rhodotorula toruloides ATCC 204091]|uniref:Epiglycanin n=1 Tax=Rhodotorula toruloides TaxID=5286 RepID=A0A2T0AHK6_RHOTO|nr:Epiglycanin [Rhodotorula toruloides ATCC 204091]PRQ77499.1 Epiglycanin [Rhodotorula toruloides]
MCTSSATLFFGVCVKILPFYVASLAWPKIEPVYLAVDLMQARRRKGELQVEASLGRTTVADLPDEIWDAIKLAVSRRTFVQEEDRFARIYHIISDDEEDWDSSGVFRPREYDIWHIRDCEFCWEEFMQDGPVDYLLHMFKKVRPPFVSVVGYCHPADGSGRHRMQDFDAMLSAFGLVLISESALSHNPDNWLDFEASCAIGVPRGTASGSKYPSATSSASHKEECPPPFNGMLEIDDAVFQLPADARSRFHRLFATFPRFEADYYSNAIMSLEPVAPTAEPEPDKKQKGRDIQKRLLPRATRDAKGRVPNDLHTMGTSSATLFFGVCVKILPLIVAARAWPEIEPVYLAIDLIRARRRRGNLRVDLLPGGATIADLPDEIWESVKDELSSGIFDDEGTSLLRCYHGDEEDCGCTRCLADTDESPDLWHLDECQWCGMDFWDAGGPRELYATAEKARNRLENVRRLLHQFGLVLSAPETASHKSDPTGAWFDIDVSCAVAVPYGTEETVDYPSASSETAHNGGGGGEGHGMIDVDPHVFQLPPDAHARFRRLFASFPQLEADQYSTTTMTVRRTQPSAPSQRPKMRELAGEEREKEGRIPRWLLWTRHYDCT